MLIQQIEEDKPLPEDVYWYWIDSDGVHQRGKTPPLTFCWLRHQRVFDGTPIKVGDFIVTDGEVVDVIPKRLGLLLNLKEHKAFRGV